MKGTSGGDRGFEVTIITGLSGAGRSEAAHVLEDLGYFVIDNLPVQLMSKVAELAGGQSNQRYAFVVDVRSGQFVDALAGALDELRQMGARPRILFLDAADDVLVRRYEASRRKHPLAEAERVSEGIARERELLEDLKAGADVVIDTSELTVHDLAQRLRELFAETPEAVMRVSVVSFGYKHGLPLDVDLVFDCRFLPNPHWVDDLRPLPGTHDAVRDYVLGHAETKEFLDWVEEGLDRLLPAFVREGKAYLSIGVGCTGGRHRSVVLAEEIARRVEAQGLAVTVFHRDLDRE